MSRRDLGLRGERDVSGKSFQPHAITHPNLIKISRDEAMCETIKPKKRLKKPAGRKSRFFAYPYGGSNEDVRGIVKNAGFAI